MTATITNRDGLFFLEAASLEAPMGFFSFASARSFAINNLRLVVVS